jgi:hypothetical protein
LNKNALVMARQKWFKPSAGLGNPHVVTPRGVRQSNQFAGFRFIVMGDALILGIEFAELAPREVVGRRNHLPVGNNDRLSADRALPDFHERRPYEAANLMNGAHCRRVPHSVLDRPRPGGRQGGAGRTPVHNGART